MGKAFLMLLVGIAIGVGIAHFVFGPVDWAGVSRQTGEAVNDAATVGAVRAALALQKDFELFGDIEVSSRDGVVTLSGRVATDEQRRLAELISRGVEGVSEVINDLEVGEVGAGAGGVSERGRDRRDRIGRPATTAPLSPL